MRKFEFSDLDGIAEVFSHPEVWQYPYGRAFSRDETAAFLDAQLSEWDHCGFGCWIAISKDSSEPIGYVGLSVPMFCPEVLPTIEVGWRFAPSHWGLGYATEGAQAALAEGFTTMGLDEICSLPQSVNPASYRVCERLGMDFERTIECPPTPRRGPVEARLYKMTRTSWLASHP